MATNSTSRFIAKNGIDNNSNTIINISTAVNPQDGANQSFVSNASNLTSGIIPGISGGSSQVNIQHYTTTTPVASTLASGQIAIDATNGYMWFVQNPGASATLKQLVTLSSNYAQSASQTATYRQTVLSGPLSQNTNRPNFLGYSSSTGVVSWTNLTTAQPLVITIANGFGASTDNIIGITSNGSTGLIISSSNIGQKQYIYYDYTLGVSSTAIPPTYGTRYSVNSQSRLPLTGLGDDCYNINTGGMVSGILRDYYGNQWYLPTGGGASQITDGGFNSNHSALFNVASTTAGQSIIDCNDFNNLGVGSWSLNSYVKFNGTLPTSGVTYLIRPGNTTYTAGDYGVAFGLTYGAASSGNAGTAQLTAYLSSNGTTWDIASNILGTNFTIPLNTWVFLTITYTGSTYYMGYAIPGIQNNIIWTTIVTSSLTICPIKHLTIGNCISGTATLPPFQMSDFAFQQYSTYITGTTDLYGNGTSAFAGNIEGDYFNIPSMQMYSLSGSGSNLQGGIVSSMTTSVISTPVPHNFVGGERIIFYNNRFANYSNSSMTTPAAQTTYYVVNPSTVVGTPTTVLGTTLDWAADGTLPVALSNHQITQLNSTTLLLTGGWNGTTGVNTAYIGTIANDVVSWTATTTNLPTTLYGHQATLLTDGRILLTGGGVGTSTLGTTNTYFITWSGSNVISTTAGTSLSAAVILHQANILSNGIVMISGGISNWTSGGTLYNQTYFTSIGTNATTMTWTAGTVMPYAPYAHSVATIPSTNSFVLNGGATSTGGAFSSVNYFGLFSGTATSPVITWSQLVSFPDYRSMHSSVFLSDGRLFVSGGQNGTGVQTAVCYISSLPLTKNNFQTFTWTTTNSTLNSLANHTATLLSDGSIFVTGGRTSTAMSPVTNIAQLAKIIGGYTTSGISYTFQIATTPSGLSATGGNTTTATSIVTTLSASPYSLFYIRSTIMEKQLFYPNVTYNSIENTLSTGCIPHGLDLGDNITLPSYFNGFFTVTPSYYVVPVSENKFRLNSSGILGTNTPTVSPSTSWTTLANLPSSLPSNPVSRRSCAYGAGLFVNISSNSSSVNSTSYSYSPDALAWTTGTLPASAVWPLCIWDGSQFVAVGVNQTTKAVYCITSADGLTWSATTTIYTPGLLSVPGAIAYGNGVYVYGDSQGAYATTNPTGTWTSITIGSNVGLDIAYHSTAGYFMARSNTGATYYSNGGIVWTAGTVLTASNYYSPIIYGNGVAIVAANQTTANTGVTSTAAYYSTDGKTWTAMVLPQSGNWMGGYYEPSIGQYVLVSPGFILYSSVGTGTWSSTTVTISALVSFQYNIYPVKGNGVIFFPGNGTGTTWPVISYTQMQNQQRFGLALSTLATSSNTLTYGKNTYLGVISTSAGAFIRSYDGLSWAGITATGATTAYFGAIAYGAGRFVALSTGTVSPTGTSTVALNSYDDGTNWVTMGALPSAQTWNGLAYGNGLFVAYAIGTATAAICSNVSSGTPTWTAQSLPVTIQHLFYAPTNPSAILSGSANYSGYFISTSAGTTTCYMSVNATTWTAITLPYTSSSNYGQNGVAGNGVLLLATSNASYPLMVANIPGNGLVSSNWTWTTPSMTGIIPSGGAYIKNLLFKNGLFVLVTNTGFVSYSNDGTTWTAGGYFPNVLSNVGAAIGNGNICFIGQTNINSNQVGSWIAPIISDSGTDTIPYNNLSLVTATPTSNLTKQQRVYLGEYSNGIVTPYSYRGEYVSDWFPVKASTPGSKYTLKHNIGTASVYTTIFYNKTKTDNTTYEVTAGAFWGSLSTSAPAWSLYGAQPFVTDRNTLMIVTGAILDYGYQNWSSGGNIGIFSNTNNNTTGYYKVKMERNW